jgi:hypothetical protein
MDAPPPKSSAGWGLAIATTLAIASTLFVNTLSNLKPPGGQNVGEIANTILSGVLITPANYAFAIWGVIYAGLIAYAVYQLGPQQRRDVVVQRVNWLLIIACLAQVVWIYLFTLQFFALSIVAMVVIWLCLAGIYLTLGIGRQVVGRSRRWYAHYPFSIYFAWISVATIVNVASALYDAGWQGGLTGATWTAIMIGVSGLIAALVILRRGDLPFLLVFLWAYGAIAVRQAQVPVIWVPCLIVSLCLVALFLWQQRMLPVPSKQGEL